MENKPVLKKVRRPISRVIPVIQQETDFNEDIADKPNLSATTNVVDSRLSPQENTNPAVNLPTVERPTFRPQHEDDYNDDADFEEEYFDDYPQTVIAGFSIKQLVIAVMVSLILGLLIGRFLLVENRASSNGLQGVVVNNEVPRGRARCGVADRSQGCVLYIMNSQRQNVRAKEFYDLASQVTGRQRFMIETGNMRYANTEIRPGDIAQLNIPPL